MRRLRQSADVTELEQRVTLLCVGGQRTSTRIFFKRMTAKISDKNFGQCRSSFIVDERGALSSLKCPKKRICQACMLQQNEKKEFLDISQNTSTVNAGSVQETKGFPPHTQQLIWFHSIHLKLFACSVAATAVRNLSVKHVS